MKINTIDPGGKSRSYRVKPLEEMTVRDYVTLTTPPLGEDLTDEYERLLTLLSRHTTIPRKALNKMPAKEVQTLVNALVLMLNDVVKAKEEADKTDPPPHFVFKGTTYLVPQDIENTMTFGAEQSLSKVLLPKCDTEAEGYAAVLAVCCLEQGEEFDAEKVGARMELFMGLPVTIAFRVCAFFFDSSDLLRRSIDLIGRRSRSSLRHRVERALKSSLSSTVH